jgi:hypothetical protein
MSASNPVANDNQPNAGYDVMADEQDIPSLVGRLTREHWERELVAEAVAAERGRCEAEAHKQTNIVCDAYAEENQRLSDKVEELQKAVAAERERWKGYVSPQGVQNVADNARYNSRIEERERCAKIAHDHSGYRGNVSSGYQYNNGYQRAAIDIEEAIRGGQVEDGSR